MPVKVRRTSSDSTSTVSQKGKKAGSEERVNISHSPFLDHLISSSEETARTELDAALSSIDEQAERFTENPVPSQLKRYKELVKNFMDEAIKKMYKVRERISGHKSIRKKAYMIVELVDEKLAQLTEDVLKGQSRTLDIVARVDEIRGMLLDLIS